jgi:hypothetical protein
MGTRRFTYSSWMGHQASVFVDFGSKRQRMEASTSTITSSSSSSSSSVATSGSQVSNGSAKEVLARLRGCFVPGLRIGDIVQAVIVLKKMARSFSTKKAVESASQVQAFSSKVRHNAASSSSR